MNAPQETTQATTYTCGNCKTENSSEAKFCEGCGHHLSEPCIRCGTIVSLSQKFCGKCGCNLEESNQQLHERYENKLAEAVKQTKLHEYEHALALLESVRNLNDYRFRSVSDQAEQAASKILALRDRVTEDALRKIEEAKKAAEKDDNPTVVNLLENVPKTFRDTEVESILQRAQRKVRENQVLQSELRTGIAEKNWPRVGVLLDQLVANYPSELKYKELAHKVAEKLIQNAKRNATKGNFNSAIESLNAIPTIASTEEVEQLSLRASKAHWCAEQLQQEPFATGMLGRIALDYAKSASKSQTAETDVMEMASRIKSYQLSNRCPLPRWKSSNKSWLGGEFSLLGLPQTDDLGKHESLRTNPGQFNVAIGLALQGLGRGRIKGDFATKKKKLLGSRRKKTARCWGLDIGSATIKAVLLEEHDGRVTIADTFFETLPTPTCRKSAEKSAAATLLLPSLMKFAEEKDTSENSVWAGFPASQTVTHFVSIPTLKEKLTQQVLDKELAQKVPLPRTEIEVVQWIGEADPANLKGKPVTLSIARKQYLNEYTEMFSTAGIDVIGLQCDSLALLNFASFEFAELREAETSDSDTIDEKENSIAFLDCGASSTNLLVVSNRSHWYWTIEKGSETANSLIARHAKVTHEKAEELKRNPAELSDPAKQYSMVEQNFLEVRARLETALRDMLNRNEQINITSTWCMGGGSLTHQWMRLVVAQETTS